MDWIKELTQKAKQDSHYQDCLRELQERESAFLQLRSQLPEVHQKTLDSYLSACEELDHAMTMIAYRLGKEEN